MFPDKIGSDVYEKKIQDGDELQEHVVEEWERLGQSVISCDTMTLVLSTIITCVQLKARGHFERKL